MLESDDKKTAPTKTTKKKTASRRRTAPKSDAPASVKIAGAAPAKKKRASRKTTTRKTTARKTVPVAAKLPPLDEAARKGVPAQQASGLEISTEDRQRMISERAYHRAALRGFVGGDPKRDWLEAEAEVDSWLARRDRR